VKANISELDISMWSNTEESSWTANTYIGSRPCNSDRLLH